MRRVAEGGFHVFNCQNKVVFKNKCDHRGVWRDFGYLKSDGCRRSHHLTCHVIDPGSATFTKQDRLQCLEKVFIIAYSVTLSVMFTNIRSVSVNNVALFVFSPCPQSCSANGSHYIIEFNLSLKVQLQVHTSIICTQSAISPDATSYPRSAPMQLHASDQLQCNFIPPISPNAYTSVLRSAPIHALQISYWP